MKESLKTATRCIAGDRYRLIHYCLSSESATVSIGPMDSLMEPYDAEAMTYYP